MTDERGPTGKKKNCNSWAEYEEKGSSPTAKLCHGGMFQGHWENPCPSRYDCAKATREAVIRKRRRLPVMNPSYRTKPRPQPRVVMSSEVELPNSISRLPTYKRYEAGRKRPESYIDGGPIPVVPPDEYPEVMKTPFAVSDHPASPPLTPVFLPDTRQEVLPRLLLNMVQGALGAGAQHVMEYTRYVDIFGSAKQSP